MVHFLNQFMKMRNEEAYLKISFLLHSEIHMVFSSFYIVNMTQCMHYVYGSLQGDIWERYCKTSSHILIIHCEIDRILRTVVLFRSEEYIIRITDLILHFRKALHWSISSELSSWRVSTIQYKESDAWFYGHILNVKKPLYFMIYENKLYWILDHSLVLENLPGL